MFVLFTDFGVHGPYLGQMKAVLLRDAPGVPIVELFSDVPAFDAVAGAYLLPAYAPDFPAGSIFLCVVDPGVGTATRRPVVVQADGRWYVGPDNGLFDVLAQRAAAVRRWEITWRPERLSASFHGRDLFAPVAAILARGETPEMREQPWGEGELAEWPSDLPLILYVDHYGNAITGLRASALPEEAVLVVAGRRLPAARTFGAAAPGAPFWYSNANGLVEVAVRSAHAARVLGLKVGDSVSWEVPE